MSDVGIVASGSHFIVPKRIMAIANQRKMIDVIKQQEEEIMFLKDELDRLRARTFPSFAHI